MKQFLLIIGVIFFTFSTKLVAQHRNCGSQEHLKNQLAAHPEMLNVRAQIEQQTAAFAAQSGAQDRTAVVTIPVVFHIVYNTSTQNVSDAQIQSQLAVLNADFARLNADTSNTPTAFRPIAADCQIQFCLAKRTPSGASSTGIERRQTTVPNFTVSGDSVKYTNLGGLDIWDRSKYMNIWVCNLDGLLGYAQLPGGTAISDGIVINYTALGTIGTATYPYNKGRTATHEVGHWLNLNHTWGDDFGTCDGSDLVADTPNQEGENYGCPNYPSPSCSNTSDIYMDYMDYTDDDCMNIFTQGQKSRMLALFGTGGFRWSLVVSDGCTPVTATCGVPATLNASSITQTTSILSWTAVSGATNYNLQWKNTTGATWTNVPNLANLTYSLTALIANTAYQYRVLANCGNTAGLFSNIATFNTLAAPSCAEQFEPNNTRAGAYTSTPVGTAFTAKISTAADKDWYQFANTASLKNIKMELTNLPVDCDLRLYRLGTLVKSSLNTGLVNETIIYNNGLVSNQYYAYVYGYNNGFSANSCYSLKITLSNTAFREDGYSAGETETIESEISLEATEMRLFPNPTMDEVTLELPIIKAENVIVNIVELAGKTVFNQTYQLDTNNNRVFIDLQNLAAGIYFVQANFGGIIETKKMIKQ
jgi:Pregnancy-associated plasma protein-A/Secretion system C-terminal sorting domain/Fibronectin type III domain